MEFADKPMSFAAGRRWLEDKVNLPLGLTSAEISNQIPARIRGQAFFSAQVAREDILQGLRKEVEAVARGDYAPAEARTRMKEFLSKQGYGLPVLAGAGDSQVGRVGSTARLNLIIAQNVAMAHAVGQREVAEHPAVMELLPNYEYVAVLDGNARDVHRRFNGLVLPKTDPFWRTHFPPWEFNCRCAALDTDAPANGRTAAVRGQGGAVKVDFGGRMLEADKAESGFEFESDPATAFERPDFSLIKDTALRAQVQAAFAAKYPPAPPAQRNRMPRDLRRMSIEQAAARLREKGFTLGPGAFENGQTTYQVTKPDGGVETMTAAEVMALLG